MDFCPGTGGSTIAGMDRMPLTVFAANAEPVRDLLRKHLGTIWFTEQRRWLLWRRFTVTGTPAALLAVRKALDKQEAEERETNAIW